MRHSESESWTVSEDLGPALTVALYLRDALGIAIQPGSDIPRLTPAVPRYERLGAGVTEKIVADWNTWFRDLLGVDAAPGRDQHDRIVEMAPGPDVRALVAEIFEAASSWSAERKREHIEQFRQQTREQRLFVNNVVDSVERTLGRKASPFTLSVTTLPVQGHWATKPRNDLLLVSNATRSDPATMRSVLEPVIRVLA